MTNEEFRKRVVALGWKYPQASRILGRSPGMIKQYATESTGTAIPPDVIQKLEAAEANAGIASPPGASIPKASDISPGSKSIEDA